MPATVDHKNDPLLGNRFFVDLGGGANLQAIQEVGGLDMETEVRELFQTTKDGKKILIKTVGATPVKTGQLTLKFATYKEDPTAKWRADVAAGKMADVRKNISVVLYTVDYEEVLRFNFKNCWPSKRVFSNFSAKGNEPVTVTLTIEHEGVDIKGYNS